MLLHTSPQALEQRTLALSRKQTHPRSSEAALLLLLLASSSGAAASCRSRLPAPCRSAISLLCLLLLNRLLLPMWEPRVRRSNSRACYLGGGLNKRTNKRKVAR